MDGNFQDNKKARSLFESLLNRAAAGKFDDEFLVELIEYHKEFPESERYDIFYAKYALAHGAVQLALESAEKAYQKRKCSFEIWRLLSDCYKLLQRPLKAVFFDGLLACHAGVEFTGSVPKNDVDAYLGVLTIAMSDPRPMPFFTREMFLDEKHSLQARMRAYVGRFIPAFIEEIADKYRFWSGIYNPLGVRNERGEMLAYATKNGLSDNLCYGDITFDIMKAYETEETLINVNEPCLIPIAGKYADQKLCVKTEESNKETKLGTYEFSFFRIEEPVTMKAESPIVVGYPIPLRHNKARKRLILNIMVDGLAWSVVKRRDYQWMPKTMEFFSKGIIFDNNYSVAEYTYPSLASIETGLSMAHTQIINSIVPAPLAHTVKTLSERMKDAGYYCSALAAGGSLGVVNGIFRGFDRLLLGQYLQPMSVAVERTIRHLEAFDEIDEFVFLHVGDVHPNSDIFPNSEQAQTKITLEERLSVDNNRVSVLLAKSKLNEYQNEQNIKNIDRNLGYLYDYLTSHYSEDEYVIHLYSDHGASVYSEKPWFLSEEQNCAAFMTRGAGVPALGIVDELTSNLDIYPTVLHNAGLEPAEGIDGNLPRALGGTGREHTVSTSIYPGQTFKMCIRTKEHEFRWEAKSFTRFDGRVDRSRFTYELYTRDTSHRKVHDEMAEKYFLILAERYTRDFAENGECWPGEEK